MKQLLPKKFYKASLHTHSTVSDGKLTPQEVKGYYKQQGYSILALTDHHVIADHSDLNDEELLCLTGIELGLDDENYKPPASFFGKSYHIGLIAKRADLLWQPYYKELPYPEAQPHLQKAEKDVFPRVYDLQVANDIIKKANEMGFFAIFNHPTWSMQSYPDYAGLEGLWGLEIRNTHNCMKGFDENNSRVYQDMLWLGKRLCPVMADDSHRQAMIGGSWTMIGAQELTYESVVAAMEKGDVYCSCGPQIRGLCWDDGVLTVECSPAAQVTVQTQARHAQCVPGEVPAAAPIEQARFDMAVWLEKSQGDENAFFRVTVTAPDGTYAITRAYYLAEVMNDAC